MKKNTRFRKSGIVLLLVMVFSLFAGVVQAAQTVDATVELFNLVRPYVLFKITFPEAISGNFAGTLAGKHFDCVQTAPNVLICIGPFRSPDPAFLTIYDQDSEENILQKVVTPPKFPGQGDEEPPAPPPQQPSGDDTFFDDTSDSGPAPL